MSDIKQKQQNSLHNDTSVNKIKQKAKEMFDAKFKNWFDRDNDLKPKVKSFIDQIIDLAIAEERKRVMEMIVKTHDNIKDYSDAEYMANFLSEIGLFITN